ncbi:MAG TPA: hypothetical protein DCM67_11565 [Propionibacteriaceae bacterium]|nr:hypothetical protein [Propionibacteriaceae bacterium]
MPRLSSSLSGLAAVALAVGALVVPNPTPTLAASTVTAEIAPHRPITAERFTVTGKIPTKVIRPVILQRRSCRHVSGHKKRCTWKTVDRGRTNLSGRYTLMWSTSRRTTRVRVVAKALRIGAHRYTRRVSAVKKISTIAQRATLTIDGALSAGQSAHAKLTFSPSRNRRPTQVQALIAGKWTVVGRGIETSTGTSAVTLTAPAAGSYPFRAIASSWYGAAAVTSPTTVVTVHANTYPSASDTGVPAGTSLQSSASLTITTPGTVIDGYDITGSVTVRANNVTIRNSRIRSADWWAVDVAGDRSGVTVEHCDIDGRGAAGSENSMGIQGPATVRANNIHDVENGIAPGSGSVIEDNYIHDLSAPGDPHYDGVQIDGGLSDITITHNTIINPHDQTAAVMIDNYFGAVDNVTVEGNYLAGGGYTVYSDGQFTADPITNVRFINNALKRGRWGYASIENNTPVDTGNVDATTGAAITLS